MAAILARPIAATPAPQGSTRVGKPLGLDKAAQEFESMFVAELLRAMPAGAGGLVGKEAGPYGDFLIDQYAKLVTEHGGLGVSAAISRQLASIEQDENR